MREGKLTGGVVGGIVNKERKRDLTQSIAQAEKITMDQVVAIGDGANDLVRLLLNASPTATSAYSHTHTYTYTQRYTHTGVYTRARAHADDSYAPIYPHPAQSM